MKKIFFLLFIAVGFMTSCVENPEEDPDPVAPIGDMQVDFDGSHFTSTVTSVVLNDESLTIKGTDATGAYFRIMVPEAPILGTYTLDLEPGLLLEYHPATGSDPFVAAPDNSGPFASFVDYTNTAQLVITNIDRINKRISGTFKFTGVRFADAAHTGISTKVFTNGSFYSLPYTATEVITNPEVDNVLLMRATTTYPLTGDPDESTIYTYNGKKIVSEVLTYGTSEQRIDYTYNAAGTLITSTETRDDGVLTETESFEYNANNKLITYVVIDVEGDIGVKETYVHNPDGSISVTRLTGDSLSQTDDDGTSIITFLDGEVNKIEFSNGEVKTYTYDSGKYNPFRNVIGLGLISFTDGEAQGIAKNILSETTSLVPGFPIYSFTFTYNTNNFPQTATENGNQAAVSFFYQ